jgi:hypothetical protein
LNASASVVEESCGWSSRTTVVELPVCTPIDADVLGVVNSA